MGPFFWIMKSGNYAGSISASLPMILPSSAQALKKRRKKTCGAMEVWTALRLEFGDMLGLAPFVNS